MRRRRFLSLAGIQLAGTAAARAFPPPLSPARGERKIVVVGFGGGTRYTESFGPQGQRNIPHLRNELFPVGTFYSRVYNDGETTHYPATAAVVTGRWQNVAEYGGERPAQPTIFEYFRKQLGRPAGDAWVVAQGKGFLTIGHSQSRAYGPAYGAHVLVPRQMLLSTYREILKADEESALGDRKRLVRELERSVRDSYLESEIGDVPPAPIADPARAEGDPSPARTVLPTREVQGIERFLAGAVARFLAESDNPRSADALNAFVAREIMTRFAPSLLLVNLGEIDIAHQGSFSLYSKAIRNADRQIFDLWRQVQTLPAYRDRTVFIVVPDHGRNLDGLGMNGFQHHRGGDDG